VNRKIVIDMLVAALAAAVLAGCSNTATPAASGAAATTTTASTAAAHNDADVAFVQGMTPHHAQAIAMSQLAAQRAASPQIKQLATTIAQAQGPEIAQTQQLLQTVGG
jgi:uncharacterized protein (DUF305 family)